MWGSCPARALLISAIRSLASLGTARRSRLNAGEMPIYEPGLGELVCTNVAQQRLSFGTALSEAVAAADAVFIAVGTPSRRGDGHADLSYVYARGLDV